MAEYLSDEWMDAAGAALSSSAGLADAAADLDLTIGYEVAGAPGGKRQYAVSFDHGRVALEPNAGSNAPVTFALDYESAVAIAKGELSPQAAFMQGRLKLGGDSMILIRDAAALKGIDDALAEVRSETTF